MSIKRKEKILLIASLASNIIIATALLLLFGYIFAPFFGGKLFGTAILKYLSWISVGLAIKIALKRIKKGLPLRKREYAIIILFLLFNLFVWFPYPFNLILSFIGILGFMASYRLQNRHS